MYAFVASFCDYIREFYNMEKMQSTIGRRFILLLSMSYVLGTLCEYDDLCFAYIVCNGCDVKVSFHAQIISVIYNVCIVSSVNTVRNAYNVIVHIVCAVCIVVQLKSCHSRCTECIVCI